jgi:hypothetical protein
VGFLAWSADYFSVGVTTETLSAATTVVTSCSQGPTTEFGLIPTVTPPGFTDPYQAPVNIAQWSAMLTASLSCQVTESWAFPAVALNAVSALTTTSTLYDDYVHPQSTSSSTSKQSTPAKNSPATTGNLKVGSSTGPLAPVTSLAPVVVAGITITPGAPAATIGGTTYSLAASSLVLVVDGSTLRPEATSTVASGGGGLGSLIWSGIGGTGSSATLPGGSATRSGAQVATFTGAANKVASGKDWRYWLAALLVAVLAAWQ